MNARLRAEQVLRLQSLETEGGRLTPAAVLEDARDPMSPLHDLFIWDNDRAAELYRLDRAREVIRSVKIKVTHEHIEIDVSKYIRSEPGPRPQGYRTITSLQRDPDAAREAVTMELDRAEGVLQRARNIAITLGLEDEVDELVARVAGLRNIVAGQATTTDGGESPSTM